MSSDDENKFALLKGERNRRHVGKRDVSLSSTNDDYDVESVESLKSQEDGFHTNSPSIPLTKDILNPERLNGRLSRIRNLNTDSSHYWLSFCAIGVHLLLLSACLNLYFASLLEHGMVPVKSTDNPPANRVVLFVADGLRADAIYGEETEQRAPLLTNIRKEQGSWGVSHVRAPTETRVGHGSILGGIYEDLSAILNGWKANPVKFDSVINQSTKTWSWGSPDVIGVFNKENGTYLQYCYPSDAENKWKNNTTLLDEWVFQRVESFLKTEMKNDTIYRQHKGIFFFLHLLGIDAAGHNFNPHSVQYINNIQFVDKNIMDLVKLFQDIFKDNKTAFVFTSDHGRKDDGQHGGGSKPEIESPIIVWGAGIKINNTRQDIRQIDIAPLLATLIGINIPANSLGILPQNYLNVQEEDLAKMQLNNVMQLLEILRVKQERIEEDAIYFVPYKGFTTDEIKKKVEILTEFVSKRNFENFRIECSDFIKIIIGGVEYYHNYYQTYLLISVLVGFVAWMLFLLSFVVADQPNIWRRFENVILIRAFILTLLIVIGICYIQNFPLLYYCYFSFPITMIYLNLVKPKLVLKLFKQVISNDALLFVHFILYVIGLGLLVLCFFYGWICLVLMVLLSIWIFNTESLKKRTTKKLIILWSVNCALLALFSLLSVFKVSFNRFLYIIIGICLWILPLLLYRNTLYKYFFGKLKKITKTVLIIQYSLTLLAFLYIICLDFGLFTKDSKLKFIPWLLLILPIILIPLTETITLNRLVATVLAFVPFYILVASDNFQAIFLYFYVVMLFIWLKMENTSTNNGTNILPDRSFVRSQSEYIHFRESFRRAFFFILFIFIGFFGPGNTSSLNSFDSMWTPLTVFGPFKMMALIVLKIIIPFIFTTCVFRSINCMLKENVSKVFYIILLLLDCMVLPFFYLVTNEGSWLDIGSSLSHFIFMENFIYILLLLYFISYLLTTTTTTTTTPPTTTITTTNTSTTTLGENGYGYSSYSRKWEPFNYLVTKRDKEIS